MSSHNQQQNTGLKRQEAKWFILQGDNKYGPFDYSFMLGLVQRGEIYDYNYIWSQHLESWTPMGEVPEFSKDRLTMLIKTDDPLSFGFYRRTAERAEIKVPVLGHNEDYFFDGTSVSLSSNGALVLLNNPLLLPGQKLMLHFKESEINSKSFNVLCQIVRKNFSRQRLNVKSGINYAVRFLKHQEWGEEQIKNLVELFHNANSKE
ncbi:MAG: PilZ domain-containing protein [Bdellovibrionaceae bacterium]|nr:PilZ domain-containing protein [Pseudobdellovibrionaceae bacterium]NUM59236.1 DUF4339 domain-containing protein [Pseudobdellovibrionaceae bacterium]